ncbi:MAG: hypothetical protein AB1Z19_01965 [Eubacteriales bacterium]
MSEFESSQKKRKKHPIRNFFYTILLVAVLFLAALFGDIFPGLNDFRDSLLEQQAYTTTQNEDVAKNMASADNEIIIQEYSIYYMGDKLTLAELSTALDEANLNDVTLSDYQGTAKQQTWQDVSSLLAEKGLAVNETVID